ncbi:MAG: AsmA family protein [Hyphomicrobiales bacterium]
MRRVIIGLSAAALLVAASVAIVPVLISTDAVKQQVAEQISAWTGAPVTLTGEPVITVFPDITVKLKGVAIAGAGGRDAPPLLTTEILRGSLRILPLLKGQIEVADFVMIRPRLDLAIDAEGHGNWEFAGGTIAAGLSSGGDGMGSDLRLGTFVMQDGIVTFRNAKTGFRTEATDIDVEVDWPALDRAGAAAGRFVWGGEVVEANVSADEPIALFNGQRTDLKFALAAPPLQLAFDGEANRVADLQLDGKLRVSTPSARRLVSWAGGDVGPGSTFGPFSISAQVNAIGWSASFTDAAIELDGNKAEGVLAAKHGEARPLVQGTLAFETLDLSAYGGLLKGGDAAGTGGWRDAPLPTDLLGALDLDLRISAGRVLLGKAKLGRTAASAVVRDRRLALEVGETVLYGGHGEGSMTVEGHDDGITGRATFALSDVKLGAMLPDFFEHPALEGDCTASADLQGRGATYAALLQTLSGSAKTAITTGAIAGPNVVRLITSALGQALPNGADTGDRTSFSEARATASIAGGIATVGDFTMTSPVLGIEVAGTADVAAATLDMTGTARVHERPISAENMHGPTLAELPFSIVGDWGSPLVVPNAGKLLRAQ